MKMAGALTRGRKRSGGGALLALTAVVLAAAASLAAVWLIVYPVYAHTGKTVSPAASSAASGSSPAASSGSSSASSGASAAAGSYSDFATAVFIGDSLTSGIREYSVTPTAGVFADNSLSTVNALTKKIKLGSGSMTVPDALKQVKPARIYVLLGANDMPWITQSAFIAGYGKVIDGLKAAAPGAVLYVQSILPVSAAYEKSSGVTNDKIDAFNTALSGLCGEKGVKYVDVNTVLKGSDGRLPASSASSGYNIKKSCYKTWLDDLLKHE